jgi:Glutamyl-tRNA amidotransferase complex subunit Gta3
MFRLPRGQVAGICIRSTDLSSRREISTTTPARKLDPPRAVAITNKSGIDLNEFTGPPGWKLEDLLPPSRHSSLPSTDANETSITPETLRHLLHLSGLPPPRSPDEESNLLSALRDQLHFVKHVLSVPTKDVEPLIRIGDECRPGCTSLTCDGQGGGVLTFEECVEEGQLVDIPGLEWSKWDVCRLDGGSPEGRDEGWFIVQNERVEGTDTDEVEC